MPDKGLYNMSNMFETLSVVKNSFISTKLFQNASLLEEWFILHDIYWWIIGYLMLKMI